MPAYQKLQELNQNSSNNLYNLFSNSSSCKSAQTFKILQGMLEYNPEKRLTAEQCLSDSYFSREPRPGIKYLQ